MEKEKSNDWVVLICKDWTRDIFKSKISGNIGICVDRRVIDHKDSIDCMPNFCLPTKDVDPCHIYILSNEEIKEGDWYYWKGGKSTEYSVVQATKRTLEIGVNDSNLFKKIIATTDKLAIEVEKYLPNVTKEQIEMIVEKFNKHDIPFCSVKHKKCIYGCNDEAYCYLSHRPTID